LLFCFIQQPGCSWPRAQIRRAAIKNGSTLAQASREQVRGMFSTTSTPSHELTSKGDKL